MVDIPWLIAGQTTAPPFEIPDIVPGIYEFRVKSISVIGVSSEYATVTKEITGLLAAPTEPQNLTISAIGGFVIIRWDQSPDLDVRIGGKIVFRHASVFTGATWAGSTTIGHAVPGSTTQSILPLKEGSYIARAVDSSGVQSVLYSVVTTKQATVLDFADIDEIDEDPGFLGVHDGTVSVDNTLRLDSAGDMDSWVDVDDVVLWDTEGGIVSSGTYTFDSGFDFGSIVRVRLTTQITSLVFNTLDLIDSRPGMVDDWSTIDANDSGAADAQVYVRHADEAMGSPSPAWGAWEKLDSAEFVARSFELQCRLTTDDPAFNIHISTLRVYAAELV